MTRYVITHNGQIVHDSAADNEELRVAEPVYQYTMGQAGKLTFTMHPTHPAFRALRKFSSEISLYVDDQWEFSGRVLDDETTFYNDKKIEVEGDLTYLNDSIVRPYNWESGSVSGYLDFFIENHNSQVEERKRYTRGNVTVVNSTDNLVRGSSSYPDSWSEMKEKLTDNPGLGGYLRTRRYQGQTYLDYLENYQSINDQVIRFGQNILDMSRYVKGEDIATAIIPLGARIEGAETETGGDVRLTIDSVNDGKDYVYDPEAVNLYGWVFHTETWDDVNVPLILKDRGETLLAQQRLLGITLQVKALDLSLVDVDAERIRVGDLIRVVSAPHNVDEYLTVESMKVDLENPEQTDITLGVERKELTDEIGNDIRNITRSMLANYVTNERLTDSLGDAMTTVRRELSSLIEQTAENITLEVSETYATKSALESETTTRQSQFEQTSENITLRFQEATNYTSEVEGQVIDNREELETYVRFSSSGMTLGKLGDPFTITIDNQQIAFRNGGSRQAYIDGNRMRIPNGDFTGVVTANSMNIAGPLRVGGNGEGGIVPAGNRTRFVGRTPTQSSSEDTVVYGQTGQRINETYDGNKVETIVYEVPSSSGARVPLVSTHTTSGLGSLIIAGTQQRTASQFQVSTYPMGAGLRFFYWIYYMAFWGEPPNSVVN